MILGLASFLITEALTGLRLQTAIFEYLKIVTPALLSLVLLPYIGFLFKNTSNQQSRTELLVFITPRILRG